MSTKHNHASFLEKLYSSLSMGDWEKGLSFCPDTLTFQIPGKSKLAGKFTKAEMMLKFAPLQRELSVGSARFEVHDILASDRHATVLGTQGMIRHGKKIELRAVHVWRFEGGSPVAFYEYPRDLYLFDEAWS